jgi:hypothetical protein
MSHNLLKPFFRRVTNNLLNTAPDWWASLKIMTWLLKSCGRQFASISLVSDSPKTTIGSYIYFLWNRSVVEILVSISFHSIPPTQSAVGRRHRPRCSVSSFPRRIREVQSFCARKWKAGSFVPEHQMENSPVICLCCSYGSNSILANMDEFGNLSVAAGR